MNRILTFLCLSAFFLVNFRTEAQESSHRSCATDELHQKSPNRSFYSGGKEFESWLKKVGEEEISKSVQDNDELYYLPVVFHVLHFGEPVGTGRNIDDSRIASQVQILNQDFGKVVGTPGYNTNSSGADSRIRFCLAAIDPNGQPTTGIVRVSTTQSQFSISNDNATLKGYSLWDPNRYLNIWVCKLTNQDIGYAQYPYTDSIQFNGVVDVQPDGVVVEYRVLGNVPPGGEYPSYNMGRTATHEIGHYLGLIHIWGDGNGCADPNGTDFCDDTPKQSSYTAGCPATIPTSCDGTHPNMRENYLDYTNDACMNIFTYDQKERMRIVMRNAIRRKTLFTTPTQCGVSAKSSLLSHKDWVLYPNPATGQIEIKSNNSAPLGLIEIRDLTGKLCISVDANGEVQKTVSLTTLASGWYYTSVTGPDGKITYQKFVRN